MNTLNYLIYPFHTLLVFISVVGYGHVLNRVLKIDNNLLNLKNLIFIKGLFFIGIILGLLNLFFAINNNLSIAVIIIGLLLYFLFSKSNLLRFHELKLIFFILIFSSIFAIFSGVSDDFGYHLEIINNYKSENLFEIEHGRRTSYNNFWLFLNSIFIVDYFSSTYFTIGSILYSIAVYDTYKLFKKSIKNKNFYVGIFSLFLLIFLLGVLNNFKDFGTDVPGFILLSYIFFFLLYKSFDVKENYTNEELFIILILACTAFVLKITNTLIFLYLLIIFLNLKFSKINFLKLLIPLTIIVIWFFQNINISGCLIWPIEITCFKNNTLAVKESYLIESFAKGDINTSISVENFSWIQTWFNNHFNKIIETYLLFIILILLPVIYFLIKSKKNNLNFSSIINNKLSYFLLLFIILISNCIWFLIAPAYRFGFFYNLSLITFLVIPFWTFIYIEFKDSISKYSRFILIIILLYFCLENILKYNWYFKRYDTWPPIINGKLINRNKS